MHHDNTGCPPGLAGGRLGNALALAVQLFRSFGDFATLVAPAHREPAPRRRSLPRAQELQKHDVDFHRCGVKLQGLCDPIADAVQDGARGHAVTGSRDQARLARYESD